MAYFHQAHELIRYTHASDGREGLRTSQIGALHAISSYFTLHERRAVVVLPTGAGKTAVLMLTPYMLRAERVLVITQSRFVREQITRDYVALRTLKLARVLPQELEAPAIFENKNTIQSVEAWETLRRYDVVISTPNSASPAQKLVAAPPPDLFDLVLIDEAHHSPAPTWNAISEAFPRARCVLFTATPFRRDGKEIRGKYIYTYPIQRAFDDEIYGEMLYLPVETAVGVAPDVALAQATERIFRQDVAAGFSHVLMVRADSLGRADELTDIYRQHTTLRLEVVHSGKSQRTTEAVVQRLRQGELDGVICVNMLGEGFDLPNLKIAALHAPHRSLAVTLQFFGRFARVNGDRLGDAKFLAVQSEIDEELGELFDKNEAWGKKIRTIGQARIGQEVFTREFLEEFESDSVAGDIGSLEALSLYSFSLFNHVKVYQVHGMVNLHVPPYLTGFETERVWVNEAEATVVFLVREEFRPKWATAGGLNRIEHHLFVVYFDEQAQLLFICATYREESLYREIAAIFVDGNVSALSLNKINRALRSFTDLELFNVGMRNRATGTVAESYRQLAGSAVHHAIDKGDGSLYHRGHIFGRGQTADGTTTIGLSSLSKVWRLESTKIPGLVLWCRSLARDIANPAPFTTGIALDHLDAGCDITALPREVVLAADWQGAFYRNPPVVRLIDADGVQHAISLLDFDLLVDRSATNADAIVVEVTTRSESTRLKFSPVPYPAIQYVDDAQPRWQIERGSRLVDLATYLTDNPLRFHLADSSLLEGCQLFPAVAEDAPYDADALMQAVDWDAAQVDIRREYGACPTPIRSLHDWLRDELVAGDPLVVFYDHRSGECADYLTVSQDADGQPLVRLYHCKGAGGDASRDRVSDLYEVCGQVTKSVQWRNKGRLIQKVKHRHKMGSVFCKGDLKAFLELIEPHPRYEFSLELYAVQPGVSKRKLSSKMATLLSTTSRGLVASGCQRLRVICSS